MRFDVTMNDGTVFRGVNIQGSGGCVTTYHRLRWVVRERLQEARDLGDLPLTEVRDGVTYDRGMYSHGAWMLRKYAGKLTIWVDNENPNPQDRFLRLNIKDVKSFQHEGQDVCPRDLWDRFS